jgi:multicomponent Na+:H+ antiporter subunit E
MQIKKNIVFLIIGFTILWLFLSQSFSWQVILTGVGVSLLVAVAYGSARYARLGGIPLSFRTIRAFVLYLFVFLRELVKANLDVTLRVIQPSLPIHPGIVEVKTKLKSPIGRLVLANSITLTPGTLTVETEGDSLFIHWIDVRSPDIEEATREIVSTFERHLEVMYG